MLSKPLVKLGNWNPQLFREIKGRLKVRNVAIAIFASLFCQFIKKGREFENHEF